MAEPQQGDGTAAIDAAMRSLADGHGRNGGELVPIKGREFVMGTAYAHAYDNEKPGHAIQVGDFALERDPVTNGRWLEFIADRGYERPELWTNDGWAWKERESVDRPEYWRPTAEGMRMVEADGLRPLVAEEPVCGVSHYEACAFATWQGLRLPSEEEWELAASRLEPSTMYPWGTEAPTTRHAAFGIEPGHPCACGDHPAGDSAEGIRDLCGNVWEWTASPLTPYPGFRAFPYSEYSSVHMDGRHIVSRGGSWATSSLNLRKTFRNWYVPGYRQGFLGVRLASS